MLKTCKGQVSIYDILMAFILFIFAFSILNGVWTKNYEGALDNIEFTEMESKALQAVNSLLKTRGFPGDWSESDVEVIGLAYKKNSVDEGKLALFSSMDYNAAKEKLKLGSYDFVFVFDAPGSVDDVNLVPPGGIPGGANVVSLKRIVEFNGGDSVVYFKVFK